MLTPVLLAITLLCGAPSTSVRVVPFQESQVIPIYVQLGYVTEVEFPASEQLVEGRVAQTRFFLTNAVGNTLYVQPQDNPDGLEGGRNTNMIVYFADKKKIRFLVKEVSRTKGAHADLAVKVQLDGEGMMHMAVGPAMVPVNQLADATRQLDEEKKKNAALDQDFQKFKQTAVAEREAAVMGEVDELTHGYKITKRKGRHQPDVSMMRDKTMTVIEFHGPNAPSVWELIDNKPAKVDVTLRGNKYVIPKQLEEGELRYGHMTLKFKWVS